MVKEHKAINFALPIRLFYLKLFNLIKKRKKVSEYSKDALLKTETGQIELLKKEKLA